MNMPATGFLFIGIIVLALAMIAIVIWVAMLSNRVKRLSDRLMYDATAQHAPRVAAPTAQPTPVAAGVSEPMISSGAMGVTEAFTPQSQMQPLRPQEPMQPVIQTSQQTVRSVQPAVARVRTNAVQPMESQEDDQAFFDSYRDKSEGQQTGAFGRERPTIPFGEDRNEAIKREAYYTKDAVDTEYDPDSIDFSRVAGYRNLRRQ